MITDARNHHRNAGACDFAGIPLALELGMEIRTFVSGSRLHLLQTKTIVSWSVHNLISGILFHTNQYVMISADTRRTLLKDFRQLRMVYVVIPCSKDCMSNNTFLARRSAFDSFEACDLETLESVLFG